ncbi:uncharacterized protein TNCV_5048181 [Trichonephila clavipes]|nr:uncharacterized protein TNCV_5048181 [Trichonephila clavipes]
MSKISQFSIHKKLIGIGGEQKSVKRLRSGDLLIETTLTLQTKFFHLVKSFLNNPVTITPHKILNSCLGLLSEPNLMGTPDSAILEDFSDQGVTQDLHTVDLQDFQHGRANISGFRLVQPSKTSGIFVSREWLLGDIYYGRLNKRLPPVKVG